jgi:hypothetical protein
MKYRKHTMAMPIERMNIGQVQSKPGKIKSQVQKSPGFATCA